MDPTIITKPIAVFYHVYMSGGDPPANFDNAIRIVSTQLDSLNASGMVEEAAHICIGVNGTPEDYLAVSSLAYEGVEIYHNLNGTAELPTMKRMQDFCKTHPGWHVLYLHTKGVIHNGNPVFENWRLCMEKTVIWNWRRCITDLNRGFDTVGAHWLTPAKYSFIGKVPYWGGNFFWATSDYLNTLPIIDIMADRYEAEVWIGKTSKKKINASDLSPHFPMSGC